MTDRTTDSAVPAEPTDEQLADDTIKVALDALKLAFDMARRWSESHNETVTYYCQKVAAEARAKNAEERLALLFELVRRATGDDEERATGALAGLCKLAAANEAPKVEAA